MVKNGKKKLSRRKVSRAEARACLKVIIEECGYQCPDKRDAEAFVRSISDGCREYRFQGALGFGGKFHNNGKNSNVPYVDCYQEEETPARGKMIEAANDRLKEVFSRDA